MIFTFPGFVAPTPPPDPLWTADRFDDWRVIKYLVDTRDQENANARLAAIRMQAGSAEKRNRAAYRARRPGIYDSDARTRWRWAADVSAELDTWYYHPYFADALPWRSRAMLDRLRDFVVSRGLGLRSCGEYVEALVCENCDRMLHEAGIRYTKPPADPASTAYQKAYCHARTCEICNAREAAVRYFRIVARIHELRRHRPPGYSLKSIVLKLKYEPSDPEEFTPAALRTRARSVLRAASLLWDRLLRGAEKDTDRGLLAHVEIDDRGFVHGHALYWGPHVSWKLMKAAIQQPLPQPRRGRPSRSRLECYPEIDCKPRAPYYFNEDGKRIVFVPGLGSLDDQEKAEDQAVAESVKYNTKSSGSMAVPLDERSWRLHPCLAAAYEIGTYRMRLWSAARGVLGNLKLETEDVADEADALDDDGTAPHEASDATHDADALVGDGVELGDSPEERGPCEHDACPGCGAVGRFRVAGPIHRVAYMKLRRAARVPWGRHGKVGAFIGRPWYPKQAEGP